MGHSATCTTRRSFLQTTVAGVAIAPCAFTLGKPQALAASAVKGAGEAVWPDFAKGAVLRTAGHLAASDRFVEAAREIPVAGHSQVLVVGSGPAGIGAALAAARAGASVQLIEAAGCLGGVWTAGLLTKIIDGGRKAGVMQEILRAMATRGSEVARKTNGEIYDPELMKVVLEEMCSTAGVRMQLHTQLAGAVVDAKRRVVAVVTESKSGRQAWKAERFIDCSGDGDLAAHAGCRFDVGVNANCECQPMSLMALVTGLDALEIPQFVREQAGEAAKRNLQKLMRDAGIRPSYSAPTLRLLHRGIFSLMTNHEYGVPSYDAGQISAATIRARKEVHAIVADLRKLGGPWRNVAVVATAEQIGVREGRRIRGRSVVTAADIVAGKTLTDAACRVNFGFDVHNVRPGEMSAGNDEIEQEVRRLRQLGSKPYDIPLGALVAADVEGLMMAGRCISGDFIAHSSYRVTGNAVPMGETAGQVAVASVRLGKFPHELTVTEARRAL